MIRRTFLGQGLMLMLVGASRRAWAQGGASLRYRPLARPVLVPLEELSAGPYGRASSWPRA